ncbi:hypothetical protein B7486_66760, partial [cyanobacterium TDX16]
MGSQAQRRRLHQQGAEGREHHHREGRAERGVSLLVLDAEDGRHEPREGDGDQQRRGQQQEHEPPGEAAQHRFGRGGPVGAVLREVGERDGEGLEDGVGGAEGDAHRQRGVAGLHGGASEQGDGQHPATLGQLHQRRTGGLELTEADGSGWHD